MLAAYSRAATVGKMGRYIDPIRDGLSPAPELPCIRGAGGWIYRSDVALPAPEPLWFYVPGGEERVRVRVREMESRR